MNQLLIPLVEFKSCLKSLNQVAAKPARYRAAKVSMEFDGRFVTLICPGVVLNMNGEGDWQGRATFSINLLLAFVRVPPTSATVQIRTDTKRILIETTSMECAWQSAMFEDADSFLSLPEPMDQLHMLQMLAKYSKDELYTQGFQAHIKHANAWRYVRITKALEHLAELGVTYDDLAHLVKESLARMK